MTEHFEYEQYEEINGVILIYLIEKNDPRHYPEVIFGKGRRSLNGYMNLLELKTSPTRDKKVFLLSKQRC